MKSLDSEPCFVDELLNFSSDIDEEEDDKPKRGALVASSLKPNGLLGPVGDSVLSFHEMVEEELEWISNKDAFPAVESFVGILSDHQSATVPKHHSPVSVLDGGCGSGGSTVSSNSNCNSNSNSNSSNSSNSSSITALTSCFSSLKAPRRARSKRRCRRRCGDFTGRQLCWSQANNKSSSGNGNGKVEKAAARMMTTTTIISRKCQHCGAEKTPQWRAGPHGPKTLCNACGVRYKSGRLVPEYRPASSPTFSSELHSNSHRKILEMRRSKQMMGMVGKHFLESG